MKRIINLRNIVVCSLLSLAMQGCSMEDLEDIKDNIDGDGKTSELRSKVIPIDTNIDFGIEPNVLYYADPRIEENGLNRAIRIDYNAMNFNEVATNGINPHSIDRAGKTNRFYIRTQNSYSFDVVNFETGSVKTVNLENKERNVVEHKPRAIGAYNRKYNIQLLSSLDMPVVDVIDVSTDNVIATLGDQIKDFTITANGGKSATGHAFWFDENHFGLIDRVSNKIRLYRVSRASDDSLEFTLIQDFITREPVHAVERISNARNKTDRNTFYAMINGDIGKKVAPGVLELKFNHDYERIESSREVIFEDSVESVGVIKATTHHSAVSPDYKYFIVPVLTGKVYFINRQTMKIDKVVEAKLGAAHVNISKEENLVIITNHFSEYVTFINATTLEVVKNLDISETVFHPDEKHLIQPHFSYVGENGRYYYTFATQDGKFLKIDLKTLEVVESLYTGGAPEQAHS